MKNTTIEARELGGVETPLPQQGGNASKIVNMTVDDATGGWSSRVGYERYRPDPNDGFDPFGSTGRVDSLYVWQGSAGGSRQTIFMESAGTLYLLHESVTPNCQLLSLIGNRNVPTASQTGSSYTKVQNGFVICNGEDHPILVRPWPLGGVSDAGNTTNQLHRNLGFHSPPSAPDPLRVLTMPGTIGSLETQTGNAVSLWWPTKASAIGQYGDWGLGFSKNDTTSTGSESLYGYKVSFISDTGSESPLSPVATVVWELEANTEGFQYCTGIRIPRGPAGTVGRRIYRTGNYSSDTDTPNSGYAYIDDVKNNIEELFFDPYASNTRGAAEPAPGDSIPFPASRARFAATFKDCLFLDGGSVEPDVLFYSHPDRIDQYGASSFIRLTGEGGGVTGLFGHYTSLVVMRESGIDVVSGDFTNGFSCTTVSNQVACRSAQAIDAVPGVGVVFLAQDGIYGLSGGLQGGSSFTLTRLSDPIEAYIQRFTPDCTARAVARYSPKEKAIHFYVAVDGWDRPNLGLVYHVEKKGWSTREGFPVGAIDRLYGGELIFGHNEGSEAAGNGPEAGLFVLSPRRALGGSVVADVFVDGSAPTSTYRSAWLDFGDAQAQKQVHYVTLWVTTGGSQNISVSVYEDQDYTSVSTSSPFKIQPPDKALQKVYGPTTSPKREVAVWDDGSVWDSTRFFPLRFPVAHKSCSWFAFEVSSDKDFVLVGWEIEFTSRGTRIIQGHKP